MLLVNYLGTCAYFTCTSLEISSNKVVSFDAFFMYIHSSGCFSDFLSDPDYICRNCNSTNKECKNLEKYKKAKANRTPYANVSESNVNLFQSTLNLQPSL